jgi:hypothetical protein
MSSSLTAQNILFSELTKEQLLALEREKQLSGEQELHRQLEVQSLAAHLRMLLLEGQLPGPEALTEGFLKAEEMLARIAQRPDIDAATKKTIEDISMLIVNAKQMERNKGITDRLQRIADETQKAIEITKRQGVSKETKEASQETIDFVDAWRPVFQLLIRSREFRQLIVDSLKIARNIVSRQSDILEEASQKFVEGDSTKQIVDTAKEQIREKSNEQQMSNEEWETLQDQMQRVLVVLARQPSYREGINRVFSLLDIFRKTSSHTVPGGAIAETHARRVQVETEELVACFAGRETIEKFKYHLRKLIDIFDSNPEFKQYLTELKDFILSSKSEEEVQTEEFKQRSKNLANRGRELLEKFKDKNEVDDFLKSSDELMKNIKNDEFVKLLRHQAGIISSDLSYIDNEGKVQVDTDMLSKLQSVLLPILAESLKYIPMPRIESSDSWRDFSLDNIVLCGYDIIPENIHLHLESDTDLSLKDIESKGSYTHLVIRLDKFRTELKDMKFYYKKKSFPELMDSGLVTFRIAGDGATLQMVFTVEQNAGENPRLTEGYADFQIHNMEIEFDKSTLTHKLLVPMMTGWAKQNIQRQIEGLVVNSLTGVVEKLAANLTQTLSQVNRPFLGGLESARQAMKASELSQVYIKIREKFY